MFNLSTRGYLLVAPIRPAAELRFINRPTAGADLRLTDFMTSNGPDVHVVLAQSSDESLKQDFLKGQLDSVELGPIKANQGDQNYDLPDSADLTKYDDVVIYCARFHVVFGLAELEKF